MKHCFRCGEAKSLDEFYAHPGMDDGHLGKCKDCTRLDAKLNRAAKLKDPAWVIAERERCRNRPQRRYDAGPRKRKPDNQKTTARRKAYRALKAGKIIPPETCQDCGGVTALEMHHTDYSQPILVQWLCTKCHGKKHRKPNPIINGTGS
jgi:hypothetical protein